MKKSALTICSIILIAVSIFGLFAAGFGIKDGLAIKAYKEADAEEASVVGQLEEGIYALKENEQAYLEGLVAYKEGLIAYEEGKASLAAGQAQINANTQAYNEGKELLSKVEPLMPYLNRYKEFRDNNLVSLPGFSTVQSWFMAVVRPLGKTLGLDIPENVTDFPAYMQQMVAEGKAQLKVYEDGLAELAAGKKNLAEGAATLEAGKASIDEFEAGMSMVNGFTMICFTNSPVYRHNTTEIVVDGPEQMLGSDYTWVKYDENGEVMLMTNGEPYLDLDKCLEVCAVFRESVDNHVASVEHELYMRLGLYIALIITCILGVLAGVRGIFGKVPKLGITVAVLAVVCNIFGLFTGYTHYIYPTRLMDGAGKYVYDEAGEYIHNASGDLQLVALIVLALGAIAFAVAAVAYSKKAAAATKEESVYETV